MKKFLITIAGGLGNQMLQYALYIHLKSKNFNCYLYLKPDELNDHHGFNIETLFPGLEIPRSIKIFDWYLKLYENIIKAIDFLNKKFETHKFNIITNVLPISVVNFPAWNNYTFITQIKAFFDEVYKFPNFVLDKNRDLNEIITISNSVSIHIRRGDYVKNVKWRTILGDICDLEYYQSSISKIKELIENPVFIIFSDDIDWSRNNLKLANAIYVDWNKGDQSYADMQLMSLCKHNIIANSTFSLMGAWLNRNIDKNVICPSKWRNYYKDKTCSLFIPDNWIVINNNKPNVSIIVNGIISKSDIKNVIKQSYTDFEILIQDEYSNLIVDDRMKVKSKNNAIGSHIFELAQLEIKFFSNRQYLRLLLINHLENLNAKLAR